MRVGRVVLAHADRALEGFRLAGVLARRPRAFDRCLQGGFPGGGGGGGGFGVAGERRRRAGRGQAQERAGRDEGGRQGGTVILFRVYDKGGVARAS